VEWSYPRVSVADARGQSGNQKEGGSAPLEVVTRRLVKTATEDSSVRVITL
jgi:hypothetical protein